MTSTIRKASEVQVGDRITEVDTPEGPFYTVAFVSGSWLGITPDDDPDLTIKVGKRGSLRVAA